jgi:glycosyltransferase EpsD
LEKKVLYVASACGHLRHFHRPYLAFFRQQGWTVHVACAGAEEGIPEACCMLEAPFRKKMTSASNLAVSARLRRLIRRERYELIIVHTHLAAFFTRFAVMGMKKRPKVINMVHGYPFGEETPLLKRLLMLAGEKLMAPVTDLLLTMNRDDWELSRKHSLGKRLGFVPGIGLNPETLSAPDPQTVKRLRKNLRLPRDAYVLLYAAEFSARKDHQVLLRALKKLPERVVLLLPGDGELLKHCRKLAKRLGVSHRVWFPGRVRNMGRWYALADCVVSSSRSEGLPFHILEPMYLGIPVVATDARGNRDLIGHKQTGLLYPVGDWVACADRIRLMMSLDTSAMTACARQKAEDYLLPRVLPQVAEKYLSM